MSSRSIAGTGRPDRGPRLGTSSATTFEMLQQAILRGELGPGAPLIETELAKWCGVSRTPVREALQKLEQDGLVVRGPRGLRVRERSPSEVSEIYEVRINLEALAARLAAERHRDVDRIRLTSLCERLEEVQREDPEEIALHNRRYHEAIWAASRNPVLVDVLGRLAMHLGRYPSTTYQHPNRGQSSLEEHRAILSGILDRDGDRAASWAAKHLSTARDIRLTMWQEDEGN